SDRKYKRHDEYCLGRSCRKCIKRCPVGAITENGHHKEMCWNYLQSIKNDYKKEYNLQIEPNVCGLCQVNVPCDFEIPPRNGNFLKDKQK
ncbi:MAG: hypothetical protein K8R68_05350, partial [Bacteroidales bacterium]|nr:hypothetical protein [Bacteroidales bacterium]